MAFASRFFRAENLAAIMIFACLSMLTGCSSFDHDWDAAASAKPVGPTDMTGRWEGTWASDTDGHTGGLRCLITQTGTRTYHARYAATYGGMFHFNYEMDLEADPKFDWVTFTGSADLGALAGGEYHYEGRADSEKFYARYTSDADRGQFNMTRPEEGGK
ncbi:MAG TPA: hypothetical protein VFE47_31325 [Tepidisphaeraceae bacterium]|jgi:hypothetical protein|nr:hypothetical protein [Tepidisphaeraceae bacterium]